MAVILKKYYQDKPPLGSQVNWGHPLSQGLVGCWLMNEGGGKKIKDLCRMNDGFITGATWRNTQRGIGLNYSGTSYVNCSNNPILNFTSQNFTIISLVYANLISSQGLIFCRGQYTNNGYYMQFIGSRFEFDVNTAGNALATSQILSSKTWYMCVGIKNGTNKLRIYINGREAIYGTQLNGYNPGSTTANAYIGCYTDTTLNFNGYIALTLVYSRVLSPNEISELYQAPYQFIQPIRRRFYSIGGVPTILPNEVTQLIMVN